MMATYDLQQTLKNLSRMDVDLVVNDNRATMISILERKQSYIRLSIHRMFLRASDVVIKAIVNFIHNNKNRASSAILQDYINKHLPLFGYEKKLDPKKLITLGEVYDLQAIYDEINAAYFENKLKLNITWYGIPRKRKGLQMTYGLYNEPMKLIKIHRLLDRKVCPKFYLDFVVYHEMLHEVYKPRKGERCTHIHTPEFRSQEKLFLFYDAAVSWEKKSRRLFFN